MNSRVRKIGVVASLCVIAMAGVAVWCFGTPTINIIPDSGNYSVSPTAPLTETTGQAIVAASGGGQTVTIPAISAKTTSGSVTSGSKALAFFFSTDFTGSVLGMSMTGTTSQYWRPPIPSGYSFPAISYTVTAGTIYIYDAR